MRLRIRAAVLCAPLLGAALVVPLAAPATAAIDPGSEGPIDPVDGKFQLEGHGYGHGRGMSQWGAQGAATLGVPYPQILSTYYPGTTLVPGSKSTRIGVLLTVDNDGDMRVRPGRGLQVATNGRTKVLPERRHQAKVDLWRVRRDDGSLRLQSFAGDKWRTYEVGGKSALSSPVKLRTDTGEVRLVLPGGTQRDYRGQAWAVADPKGVRGLRVVNNVLLESYLRSVVPSESFPSWEPAALRAQAVAARTYALWKARNTGLGYADICDTTACQVYHGRRDLYPSGRTTQWETPSTDAAIAVTAGRRLEYGGAPALTEFSASNGGWSTTGDKPYLVAREDLWDGVVASIAHAWTITVTTDRVRRSWPSVGEVVSLRVVERDGNGEWGGRVRRVEIVGMGKTITVSGQAFAHEMGLRHVWWHGKEAEGSQALLEAKSDDSGDARDSRRPAQVDRPVEEASSGAAGPEQFETNPYAPPAR